VNHPAESVYPDYLPVGAVQDGPGIRGLKSQPTVRLLLVIVADVLPQGPLKVAFALRGTFVPIHAKIHSPGAYFALTALDNRCKWLVLLVAVALPMRCGFALGDIPSDVG
jgi:hypothetical protein